MRVGRLVSEGSGAECKSERTLGGPGSRGRGRPGDKAASRRSLTPSYRSQTHIHFQSQQSQVTGSPPHLNWVNS